MVDLYDVPALHLSVPIELINKFTRTTTALTLHACSYSVSQYGEYADRPDFSVCLVSDEYKSDRYGPRGPAASNKYHQRKEERQIETTKLFQGRMTEFVIVRLPNMMLNTEELRIEGEGAAAETGEEAVETVAEEAVDRPRVVREQSRCDIN